MRNVKLIGKVKYAQQEWDFGSYDSLSKILDQLGRKTNVYLRRLEDEKSAAPIQYLHNEGRFVIGWMRIEKMLIDGVEFDMTAWAETLKEQNNG